MRTSFAMSEVYAARSVAKKHIIEQCENCNLKKNSNGLYNLTISSKYRKQLKANSMKFF